MGCLIYVKPLIENSASNLVICLQTRMHKDGRQPQTFRLTIRRYSVTNKWFSRESRQAPIPNHIGQKITSGKLRDTAMSHLLMLSTLVSGFPLITKILKNVALCDKREPDSTRVFIFLLTVCFTPCQLAVLIHSSLSSAMFSSSIRQLFSRKKG